MVLDLWKNPRPMNKKQTGQQGEDLAASHITGLGYRIMHRNWRYKYAEVDIIASKDGTLHFMEVKTRSSYGFGAPEIKVDKKKLGMLKTAAEGYLFYHPQWKWIQFDVLAIVKEFGKPPDIFMIEDVF
jgi:putative endonuclease